MVSVVFDYNYLINLTLIEAAAKWTGDDGSLQNVQNVKEERKMNRLRRIGERR